MMKEDVYKLIQSFVNNETPLEIYNMAKAYDRISKDFIYLTLQFFKFPYCFQRLIMKCITSVSIAIRLNGYLTEYLQPSRGLRQGGPLSPLIFNLCMTQLSMLIFEAVFRNLWHDVFY